MAKDALSAAYYNEVVNPLLAFREKRGWGRHHTPRNLAQAISVEAGELQELFLWGRNPTALEIGKELADIWIYVVYLADSLELDPWELVQAKIEENQTREWPEQEWRPYPGSW
jgi:NTP pyrophosphatase (non-canonical NTP hydrolase)